MGQYFQHKNECICLVLVEKKRLETNPESIFVHQMKEMQPMLVARLWSTICLWLTIIVNAP